ncbi:hypothetical protein CCP3SC1AL1_410002 [Gammaproteobacteria bacterium]
MERILKYLGVTQLDSQVTDSVGFIVFDEKQNFYKNQRLIFSTA